MASNAQVHFGDFRHGAHDYTCICAEAPTCFDSLTAPLKGFHTFSRSAHRPIVEEPDMVMAILREDVLEGTNCPWRLGLCGSLRLFFQLPLVLVSVLRGMLFLALFLVLLAFVSHESPPGPGVLQRQWRPCHGRGDGFP
jgi:hypothetical protein